MKLFNKGSAQGYGNIYTPHAGSMIIQVQREHGLANRTIVVTPTQIKALKLLFSRKGLIVWAVLAATWLWMVADRTTALVENLRNPNAAANERLRIDSLARQLHELQSRYDHVSRMLGSTSTPTPPPAPNAILTQ